MRVFVTNAIVSAKILTGKRCECGVQLTQFEAEEYGKCWFCLQDEKVLGGDAVAGRRKAN